MHETLENWDVVIVGGGPAGLSAALILGRCRWRVLLYDEGRQRNAVAREAHGFYTRDGTPPDELVRIGREQLEPYAVTVRQQHVEDARRDADGFQLVIDSGETVTAHRLVLATGIRDRRPAIAGFEELFGTSIWSCPYCDGWEARDWPLAALAHGSAGADFALGLGRWSNDVVLLTNGAGRLTSATRATLERNGIRWNTRRIARLEGRDGHLERVVFVNGEVLPRRGLFFHLGTEQASPLPRKLGCRFDRDGRVLTSHRGEETGVPGLHVVGDASHDLALIAVATAEGVKAACRINRDLRLELSARRASAGAG